MQVAAIYNPLLISVEARESVFDAAERMQTQQISSAAVYDGAAMAGILTERDVCRAVAARVDLDRTPVREFMTRDPAIVTPETHGMRAAQLMLELGVRHLPVFRGERLVGMVSIRDLLEDAVWTGPYSEERIR